MVDMDHDSFVRHGLAHPLTFITGDSKAFVNIIVGDPIKKTDGILVGHFQLIVLHRGKPGGVRRMNMKDAECVWTTQMNCSVNV